MAHRSLNIDGEPKPENNNPHPSTSELLASKCLDPLDVMEIMKISMGTLSNLCKQGLLEVSKVGNRLYFDIDDIIKMLNEGKKRYRNEMAMRRKKNK